MPSQNARCCTASTCAVPAAAIWSAACPAPSNGERTLSPTSGTSPTADPASRSLPASPLPAASIFRPGAASASVASCTTLASLSQSSTQSTRSTSPTI